MNSAGSENGSLTSRGCTSQVTSYPCSFAKGEPAAARHRGTQKQPRRELWAAYLIVLQAQRTSLALNYFVQRFHARRDASSQPYSHHPRGSRTDCAVGAGRGVLCRRLA